MFTEFRDGNVPAGHEMTRVLDESLENIPPGVERVRLRSDTAGYQQELPCHVKSTTGGKRGPGSKNGAESSQMNPATGSPPCDMLPDHPDERPAGPSRWPGGGSGFWYGVDAEWVSIRGHASFVPRL